jgi:hypothetical protein
VDDGNANVRMLVIMANGKGKRVAVKEVRCDDDWLLADLSDHGDSTNSDAMTVTIKLRELPVADSLKTQVSIWPNCPDAEPVIVPVVWERLN